jgi:NhaP-type Na+/H+ or K+/H+ antiporter
MFAITVVLCLFAVIAALVPLANRLAVPVPILLVIGGLILGFVPGLPHITLRPSLVFLVFLPPLLYRSAVTTSWREFRANLRPISFLAIGGGVAIGLLAGWTIAQLGRRVDDPLKESTVSLLSRARTVAKSCQSSPGIFSINDFLPCTTSSCERGRI